MHHVDEAGTAQSQRDGSPQNHLHDAESLTVLRSLPVLCTSNLHHESPVLRAMFALLHDPFRVGQRFSSRRQSATSSATAAAAPATMMAAGGALRLPCWGAARQ